MKWIKWTLVLLLVVAAVVVFSTDIFQKKYTFYYYPEWNAYYDVRHKNYIYSIDGGKNWDTITNSSNGVADILGEKIVLHSRSADVWLDNARHRADYGGTLNDLVGGFLLAGDEKGKPRKKNSFKDSSQRDSNATYDFITDSSNTIDYEVNEPAVQEKNGNQNDPQNEDPEENNKPENEPVDLEKKNDSLEVQY